MLIVPEEYWVPTVGVLTGVVMALVGFSYTVSWIENTNPQRMRRLKSEEEVSAYRKGNRFITHHFRPVASSYREAFYSIFELHNEVTLQMPISSLLMFFCFAADIQHLEPSFGDCLVWSFVNQGHSRRVDGYGG